VSLDTTFCLRNFDSSLIICKIVYLFHYRFHCFPRHYGMMNGCLLSPFIFLIVVEALSKVIVEARRVGPIRGLKVFDKESISHILFIDDVLYFFKGSIRDNSTLKWILYLLCEATRIEVNIENPTYILSLSRTPIVANKKYFTFSY